MIIYVAMSLYAGPSENRIFYDDLSSAIDDHNQ